MGPLLMHRLRCVSIFGFFLLHTTNSTNIESITTTRLSTHDNLFPVENGLETDTTGTTVYACALRCRQNVDCGGFVFASTGTTSLCQLYQSTWETSTATTLTSAMFYLVESRDAVTCLAGWVEFLGSCYLFDEVSMFSTFAVATAVCTSYGGYLVHVNTEQENTFIKDNCKNYLDSNGNVVSGCWIGLTDSAVEGEWKWLDNGESVRYTDWHHSQPNEGTFANCLVLYNVMGYNVQWTDEPCGYSYMPICEIYMGG